MGQENLIKVRSKIPTKKDGTNEVVVWDRDDAHPDGEAFIAGPTVVEVAPTAAITSAIHAGKIEVVEGEADPDALLASGASTTGTGAPPNSNPDAEATGTEFPEDFPHRDALLANNVTTVEQLKGMTADEVNNLSGIGESKKADIAKALKKL